MVKSIKMGLRNEFRKDNTKAIRIELIYLGSPIDTPGRSHEVIKTANDDTMIFIKKSFIF